MCILKLERTIHRHVHIYTHTENNGWKKSVKATSSDSQGDTTGSGVTCGQLDCGHLLPC